jgi:hypothetical protein
MSDQNELCLIKIILIDIAFHAEILNLCSGNARQNNPTLSSLMNNTALSIHYHILFHTQ